MCEGNDLVAHRKIQRQAEWGFVLDTRKGKLSAARLPLDQLLAQFPEIAQEAP